MKLVAHAKLRPMSGLLKPQLRFLLLAAAAVATACACRQPARLAGKQVQVEVVKVGLDRESGAPYVMLLDRGARRGLPIWIGENEAHAIMLELQGLAPDRPMTSDLLRSVLEKTGNRVDRAVITDLRNKTYYARIFLDNGRYDIDSRPSDAIVLALGVKAPIYVAASVLRPENTVDMSGFEPAPQTTRALGITVQELSPGLAEYFKTKPGSGVLVADVQQGAAEAGVARGDILTRVAGHAVHNPGEFARNAATLKSAEPVALTLQRAGQQRIITLKNSSD